MFLFDGSPRKYKMGILDSIRKRRSVREFKDREIPESALETLIEAWSSPAPIGASLHATAIEACTSTTSRLQAFRTSSSQPRIFFVLGSEFCQRKAIYGICQVERPFPFYAIRLYGMLAKTEEAHLKIEYICFLNF